MPRRVNSHRRLNLAERVAARDGAGAIVRDVDQVRLVGLEGGAGRLRALLGLLLLVLAVFCSGPALAQVQLAGGQAGIAYAPITLSNPAGAITAVEPNALPFGMNLDMATGLLDGTPLDYGDFSVDVTFGVGPALIVTYDFTIAPPDLVLDPTPLPAAMVGRAYSVTRAISGTGSGFSIICTCVVDVVPAQPGGPPYFFPLLGVDHDPFTGQFFGTPTDVATVTIDAHAFDAGILDIATGQPFEGPTVTYTLVITPALALTPSPLADGVEGTVYNQAITPPTGGAGPYTFAAVGTLPAGIAVDPATGAFIGTPAVGSAGAYSVQVKATDANGYEVTAGPYALTVGVAAVAFPPTLLPAGVRDTPYSQILNAATGGREPFAYALTAGALPAGVTFDPLTRTVGGTPTVTGTFDFTVTATDALTTSVKQTYQLVVAVPALALPPTALPDGTILFAYGQSIVEAIGGTAPYTYAVTGGALPQGLAMDAAGRLSGTPSEVGTFGFTVTATDANAATAQRAYALTITMLPDPRTADLLDLLKWQHHAAALLAGQQNDNINQRLEQLHNGPPGGSPGIVIVDQNGSAYLPKIQDAAGSAIDAALDTVLPANIGLWTAGKLTVGTIDQLPSVDFSASSLTVGWDYRVGEMLTLGLAAGFGADRGVVGTSGTTGDAAAKYLAGYASFQPGANTFLDATLGAGIINYDTHRFVPLTGLFATGHRDGQQVFGSLSGGFDHPVGNLDLSGYGRVEGSFARLGAYTETGGLGALAFTAQDVWALSGLVGLKADYSFHLEWGTVTPGVRVEFHHGSFGASDAMVNYADLLNLPGFGLSGSLAAENAGTVGVQTAFAFSGGLGVTLGYDAKIGVNGTVTHSVRGIVGGSF